MELRNPVDLSAEPSQIPVGGTVNGGGWIHASDAFTATIDFGDETGSQPLSTNGDGTFSFSHSYSSAGTHLIDVVARTSTGLVGGNLVAIGVGNTGGVAPVVSVTAWPEGSGLWIAGSGSISDPDSSSFTASIEYGNGMSVDLALAPDNTFTFGYQYSLPGTYAIMVRVIDDSGLVGTGTADVEVGETHVPPTVTVTASPSQVAPGESVSISGSITDPDSTDFSVTIDYGDSATETIYLYSDYTFSFSHSYASTGNYSINVSVSDEVPQNGSASTSVAVNDGGGGTGDHVAPTVSVGADPNPGYVGEIITFSGSVEDSDSWSVMALIDYGDGCEESAQLYGDKAFAFQHAYDFAGTYTVTVTATDDTGLEGSASVMLSVVDAAPQADLEIDGLVHDEDAIGGLVVPNQYGNNAPRSKIILKLTGGAWQGQVELVRQGANANGVRIEMADGSEAGTEFGASQIPLTLYVVGVTPSQTMRDVTLTLRLKGRSDGADDVKYTVLWIDSLTASFSGPISQNNAARNEYIQSHFGSDQLGFGDFLLRNEAQSYGCGTEAKAVILPRDFDYPNFSLAIRRDMDLRIFGTNNEVLKTTSFSTEEGGWNDEDSLLSIDFDPAPDGCLYTWDPPRLFTDVGAVGDVRRFRANFKIFVAADLLPGQAPLRVSLYTHYYVRFSMKCVADGAGVKRVPLADIAGDNEAQLCDEFPEVTWNLQSNPG